MMMDNNILESLEALTPLDVKDLPLFRIERYLETIDAMPPEQQMYFTKINLLLVKQAKELAIK